MVQARMASKFDTSLERRRSSYEIFRPYMSERRVVLLGNNWSEQSSVGNFLLENTKVFDTDKESNRCVRVRRMVQDKDISVINTPDLLRPDLSEHRLTELIEEISEACAPGPHVFLLVLQPEDFTETHKTKLQSVLERFSEQVFDHSLVLISPPQNTESGVKEKYLKQIIEKCKGRFHHSKNLPISELLRSIEQIVQDQNGEHLKCGFLSWTLEKTTSFTLDPLNKTKPPLRILMLGKSDDRKARLGNFILGYEGFTSHKQCKVRHCIATYGQWNEKSLIVVNTPDMFTFAEERLKEEMSACINVCLPGPNALLIVKPSSFNEKNRQTLMSVLGPSAFKHCIVIRKKHGSDTSLTEKELIKKCNGRQYSMVEHDRNLLMEMIETTVIENRGSFLTIAEENTQSLNLVLCGRSREEKAPVVKSILGVTALPSALSPEQCVKHQGEVCGRWVSVVELPALSGKPLETVIQQCLSCISLCGPEGVHAFILVLPVGPLTDQDKAELKTIQDTFSSPIHDHFFVLFTVESDPLSPAVRNFMQENTELRRLREDYGDRCVVFSKKERSHPEMLKILKSQSCNYTLETFTCVTMSQNVQKDRTISTLETELKDLKNKIKDLDDAKQSPDCLRIVLIGKTGSGKSSSGNTILGREAFKSHFGQTSVTKVCQKEQSTVDGRLVAVVDTPGLFDTNMSQDDVNNEMLRCISLLAPGPHVFLLVLEVGRLTDEEKETLKLIQKFFGTNSQMFTVILFTRGDSLQQGEMSINQYIETSCDDSFKKLVSDCGKRYHVFNNFDHQNRAQVSELIIKLEKMVKRNGGSCYTSEMFQEAEQAIKDQAEKLLKEGERELRREIEQVKQYYENRSGSSEGNDRKMNEEIAEIRTRYETESRKQAEEINEFKLKYKMNYGGVLEQHNEDMKKLESEMQESERQHSREFKSLHELACYNEAQLKEELKIKDRQVKKLEDLKKSHEEEMQLYKEKYKNKCTIL